MISKDNFLEKVRNMDRESLEQRLFDIYLLTEEFLNHSYSELNMCGEDLRDILESNTKQYYLSERYKGVKIGKSSV